MKRGKARNVNNLRLRVLAAASLAAGLSASHFDEFEGVFWERRRVGLFGS